MRHASTGILRRFIARAFDEEVPSDEPDRDGYFTPPPPRLHRAESESALAFFVADDIRRRVTDGSVLYREVAILYRDKWSSAGDFRRGNREFVESLLARLAAHAVPGAWVSQDQHAKAHYDATSDRVAVMSYHSAKGFEFDLVYVLGVDRLDETLADREEIDAYLRCALTRACYELVVPYVRVTNSVSRLTAAAAER